jgi:hypothetical protein
VVVETTLDQFVLLARLGEVVLCKQLFQLGHCQCFSTAISGPSHTQTSGDCDAYSAADMSCKVRVKRMLRRGRDGRIHPCKRADDGGAPGARA